MQQILDHLLSCATEVGPIGDLEQWWSRHRAAADPFDVPVDRAMAGAAQCDRLGYAFASGYREALRALIPDLRAGKVALCATERGGNSPRAIESRLTADGDGWRLAGEKSFVTMGQAADDLLVFATAGVDDRGRNRLAAVHVPSTRDGVAIESAADTPFVPEIPHARATFTAVRVEPSERLPGDAYDRYLKPFRTVEDAHVHAALLAWLLPIARRTAWPTELVDRFATLIASARTIAMSEPASPATHVALGGLIAETARLLTDARERLEQTAPHWTRDRPLLQIASTARARRLERAHAALASRCSPR